MWDVQELFRRYSRDLNRFLHHRVSSREIAADLTQDLFLKLLTTDNSAVVIDRKSYLFRAASNLALNHIKRERLIDFCDPSSLEAFVDDAPSAERTVLSRQELARVVRVLSEIPPVQREIFILSRMEGLTFQAISERLGMSVPTVYRHVFRILLRLQSPTEKNKTA